ncbi:MAG: DUF2357 domain-containing protein [Anaeroplasmataceae bacterium]
MAEVNEKESLQSASEEIIPPTTEEENDDSVSEFYRILSENFDSAREKSSLGDMLFNQIKGGSRTVYSKTIRETKIFEKSFIPILETCFKSISKILKDPKKAIRYEQDVVPMEKVKKVNSDTVRHLASHTQNIKLVTEEGDIIPSKLLTTFAEDEIGIYENRFIKTLINRICKFLSLRVQIMKKNLDSYETKNTTVTNSFKFEKTKVKVELSVKMERQLDAQIKAARETFEKAQAIHENYKTLRSSKLMQDLKNYKEVTPPILKTNIILKNAEFKVCYNTWVFLDRYNELAFDVNVKEKKNKYPDELAKTVDGIMSEAVGTMLYFNGDTDLDPENTPYKEFTTRKAKMLSKMDDEYKFNPTSQKLEKFEMSEYFLNKTQEFYQQSLDDKVNSGMEKKYSLELVFREMQEVLNSIYPPLFEMPIEGSFDEVPLPIKLERAKKKSEVLETVTRLKEIDYNNTKKEYDDTLAEIQMLEEKIRQQEAREARLAKLAKEKAERAEKRAREREEAQRLHEEEMARKKAEREAAKAASDQAKAAEKARMAEAKAKLMERRAAIKAEQDAAKAKRAEERARKKAEREEAEKARLAEEERIAEEERKLEAEKAHLDAKELLRRRREIIRQKAAAAKAKEEALKNAELEDDEDEDDDSLVRSIDERIKALDSMDENDMVEDEDDDEETSTQTLDPKELLRRRREAIRQKALANKNSTAVIEEDDEDNEHKEEDARTKLRRRREALESQQRDELFSLDSDIVQSSDEQSTHQPSMRSTQMDSRSMFERNRDIIRRRALEAQKKASEEQTNTENISSNSPSNDDEIKEALRKRREAIRQRALEAKNRQNAQAHEEEDEEDTPVEESIDPKELLRRRREAIRRKALEAQAKEAEKKADGWTDLSPEERKKIIDSHGSDDDE